ncbi:M16 family metallopeptidase [Streptomyces sp. AM8-1-1]|uniref:M16 family metallopeptidase n=1 Tax=Streptomyces sp. AM8-1-1 TaxID=3075825 RepID=UPI0028C488FB|nr:insulinase family protein [Streptomyces sp. AM8-1-1]WNO73340.1 insulinase family protein [Streptomyces sp. AM8-1-1]
MSPHVERPADGPGLVVESVPYARGLAAVALTVAAGGDDDPPGRHGMAHLVEHLMFPRSETYETHETYKTHEAYEGGVSADDAPDSHVVRVEGAGGVCNAETHRDHTVFHTTVPASMLDDVLAWEARRLREFAPSAEAIRTETAVIAEEIRGTAGSRIWDTVLASVVPGARDSFGTASELARTKREEALAFFGRHYTADRMVLSIVGDVDTAAVAAKANALFAGVRLASDGTATAPPPRSALPATDPAWPATDPASLPLTTSVPAAADGVALGHRLPDPVTSRSAYLAHVVLAEVLARSHFPRLVRRDPRFTAAGMSCGLYGQWLASAAPDVVLVRMRCARGVGAAEAVDAWRDVLRAVAGAPVDADAHRRAVNSLLVAAHRQEDSLVARAVGQGRAALLFGGHPATPAAELAAVTPLQVADAARALLAAPPTVTELVGGPR